MMVVPFDEQGGIQVTLMISKPLYSISESSKPSSR